MTIQTCREIAARIWCDPAFRHQVMDVEKCEQIAQILLSVVNPRQSLSDIFEGVASSVWDGESQAVTTMELSNIFERLAKTLKTQNY